MESFWVVEAQRPFWQYPRTRKERRGGHTLHKKDVLQCI